ncbi:MAG TPA: hypothetical protein VGM90_10275 [Kofleriaceae bacterium]
MVRLWGASLLVCALGVASAETPQQEADRLFTEGREALSKNDPKRACELFESAIKLDASATGTMLNLGLCYEQMGKYASSIKWFRKAQSAASENKLTQYEDAAKTHTGAISPKVSILTISLANAASAEVRVDGIPVESVDYGRMEVDSGSHTVTGTAEGKALATQTIEIKEAENKPVTLVFKNEVEIDRGKPRRKLAYIVGGSGGAILIGVAAWGIADKIAYDNADKSDDKTRNRLQHRQHVYNTTLFGVGSAAVIAAGILYFTAPGKERVAEDTAFSPVITPDQVGFAYGRSF